MEVYTCYYCKKGIKDEAYFIDGERESHCKNCCIDSIQSFGKHSRYFYWFFNIDKETEECNAWKVINL